MVVLEKTLESPLDCKEIQQVHPKGDQSWVFIGRIDVEAETPMLWPCEELTHWKRPDAGRDWGQEEMGQQRMRRLDGITDSMDITLPTKVRLVKAIVFPVVVYGCESWTVKKAECQRIDAFELWWCWRRLFSVPWIARRSNLSILKEISFEYSLEGPMLKLELQYFCDLM